MKRTQVHYFFIIQTQLDVQRMLKVFRLSCFWNRSCHIKVHQVHDDPDRREIWELWKSLAGVQSKRWKSHKPNNEARKRTGTTARRLLLLPIKPVCLKPEVCVWGENEADGQRPQTRRILTAPPHYFQFDLTFDAICLDLSLLGTRLCYSSNPSVSFQVRQEHL